MDKGLIIITTEEELTRVIERALGGKRDDTPAADPPKRLVYGLRGIADLFRVSHTTAQQYKNSFLAPAVTQRGRKIIVDADKAVELFEATQKHS